jgi:hypothetical protein
MAFQAIMKLLERAFVGLGPFVFAQSSCVRHVELHPWTPPGVKER